MRMRTSGLINDIIKVNIRKRDGVCTYITYRAGNCFSRKLRFLSITFVMMLSIHIKIYSLAICHVYAACNLTMHARSSYTNYPFYMLLLYMYMQHIIYLKAGSPPKLYSQLMTIQPLRRGMTERVPI